MAVFLLLLSGHLLAAPAGGEKDIQTIRERFGAIRKALPACKKAEMKDDAEGSWGEATGYFYKGKLVLIESKAGGEYCVVETDFYFHETRLFFTFRREDCRYPDDTTRFAEERFYFKDGKCLRYLSRSAKTPEALKKAKQKQLDHMKSPEPANIQEIAGQLKGKFEKKK
jgi:hypothetical protein